MKREWEVSDREYKIIKDIERRVRPGLNPTAPTGNGKKGKENEKRRKKIRKENAHKRSGACVFLIFFISFHFPTIPAGARVPSVSFSNSYVFWDRHSYYNFLD